MNSLRSKVVKGFAQDHTEKIRLEFTPRFMNFQTISDASLFTAS